MIVLLPRTSLCCLIEMHLALCTLRCLQLSEYINALQVDCWISELSL